MSSERNAFIETFKSIGLLLDKPSLKKGRLLVVMTAMVSVADVIALAAVVPVLMLAIDGDFLAKSRKLRAIHEFIGIQKESDFLLVLIALVAFFFIVKNIFAVLIQKRIHILSTKLVQNFTENTFYHVVNQTFENIVAKGT